MTEQSKDLLADLKARTAAEQASRKAASNVVPLKREVLDLAAIINNSLENAARAEPAKAREATLKQEVADPAELLLERAKARPAEPIELGHRDSARIGETVRTAMRSLADTKAHIYQRGGKLVQPVIEPAHNARGAPMKVASLIEFDADSVKLLMMEHLRFCQRTKDGLRYVNPGPELPRLIMKARGSWPFPNIAGLINAPTLRPNGSLLQSEGYDVATGLLLLNAPKMAPIKLEPTRTEAEAALALLKELLAEFPFKDAASRSVALSLILSTMVCGALEAAPLHLLMSPTAGSGKSFLVDIASAIATGERCAVVAATASEEEREKRIAAAMMTGRALVSLDNLNGVLASDLLCQAVSQPVVTFRPLGKSDEIRIVSRSVFTANGNNIAIADDLARRTVLARLDPEMEKPWERAFAKHPLAMIEADRGRYIAAALTIPLAYLAAVGTSGCEVNGFEGWSQFVRDPLVWLGEADPAATMDAAREGDPKLQASLAAFVAIAGMFGCGEDKARTAAQMIEAVEHELLASAPPPKRSLKEALMTVAGTGKVILTNKLGYWLRQNKGKVLGGLCLCGDLDRTKTMRWWVEQVGEQI